MKKPVNRIIFGVLLLLLVSLTFAQTTQRSKPDIAAAEQYIRESEAKWAESVATGKTSDIERILADDFIGTDPKGNLYDKASMIADTKEAPKIFISNRLDQVKIRFFGNTAVAQGSEAWERRDGERGRFVWTDTWVLRNGNWQIVAAEDLIAAPLATAKDVNQVPDPLTMAPDNYKLVLENDRVRVLMFTAAAGAKWGTHRHPDQISVALAEYDIRNVVPGNPPTEIHRKLGDVRWIPATSHTGENIGRTEARSVVIELKK